MSGFDNRPLWVDVRNQRNKGKEGSGYLISWFPDKGTFFAMKMRALFKNLKWFHFNLFTQGTYHSNPLIFLFNLFKLFFLNINNDRFVKSGHFDFVRDYGEKDKGGD